MSGTEAWLLRRLRKRAIHDQHNRCWWCQCEMAPPEEDCDTAASAEHLKPRHAGGRTEITNIVAACRKCNNERHPEFNHGKEALVFSAGDETPSSPFAALRVLLKVDSV